jgi:hypothetical protein
MKLSGAGSMTHHSETEGLGTRHLQSVRAGRAVRFRAQLVSPFDRVVARDAQLLNRLRASWQLS